MLCPICSKDTKVLESRNTANYTSIRRRRECLICTFRFSTVEEVEILDLGVIKKNNTKEPYSREKLFSGLKRSLQKREITPEKFKKLLSDIERDIQLKTKNHEITTKTIGAISMKHLKKIDDVAYIRFASVYQDFKTIEDFAEHIKKLKK